MKLNLTMPGMVILFLILAALAADVLADGVYNLSFGLSSGGGGTSSSGALKVTGTAGQPATGDSFESLLLPGLVVRSGFWNTSLPSVSAVGEELPATPLVNRLNAPYPNPFNPSTNIRFELATAGRVRVKIYDARGQMVRDLVREDYPAGRHEVAWNGRNDQGGNAASGIYFIRFEAGNVSGTKKMTLLK
ncbi:MAG: FlgD immunoglobulin-like domain containing protein [Candidatus Krumholzibacteriota bacterium]